MAARAPSPTERCPHPLRSSGMHPLFGLRVDQINHTVSSSRATAARICGRRARRRAAAGPHQISMLPPPSLALSTTLQAASLICCGGPLHVVTSTRSGHTQVTWVVCCDWRASTTLCSHGWRSAKGQFVAAGWSEKLLFVFCFGCLLFSVEAFQEACCHQQLEADNTNPENNLAAPLMKWLAAEEVVTSHLRGSKMLKTSMTTTQGP